ncbi:MAG: hypothetical protein RL071_2177 [Pseudomonadota bacterium]
MRPHLPSRPHLPALPVLPLRPALRVLPLLLAMVACTGDEKADGGGDDGGQDSGGAEGAGDGGEGAGDGGVDTGQAPDTDGDGYPDDSDCDPNDNTVYPGAPEVPYDGIDQDCFRGDLNDIDLDGYPGGSEGPDCDDGDPEIRPGVEDYADTRDNDCDGEIDEDVREAGSDWPVIVAGRDANAVGGAAGWSSAGPLLAVQADMRVSPDVDTTQGITVDTDGADWGIQRYTEDRVVLTTMIMRGDDLFEVTDLAATDAGHTFAVGAMAGTVYFDREGVRTFRTSMGGDDAFFARFDEDGEPVWAWSMGGAGAERATTTLLAGDGIVVGGTFETNLMVNPGAPPEDAAFINAPHSKNGFLARYDADGLLLWAVPFAAGVSTGEVTLNDIAFSNTGDLWVLGTFSGAITPPSDEPLAAIAAEGTSDLFLAKVNAGTGDVMSFATFGDAGAGLQGTSIGALGGLLFVGGGYTGAPYELPTAEIEDGIVLSVSGDGSVWSARRLGSPGADRVAALAVSPIGELYALGSYGGPLDVGGTILDPVGSVDCFIAKLDTALGPVSVTGFGSATGAEDCASVAVSPTALWFAGTSRGDLECSLDGGDDTRALYGASDAFLHRVPL